MNAKGNKTTTKGLEWNTMVGFATRLRTDDLTRDYLLVTCGSYFGLRISDLLSLKFSDVMEKDEFTVLEKKTRKTRTITINQSVKDALNHTRSVLMKQGKFNRDDYMFANRWSKPVTVSYINKRLPMLFTKYNVRCQNGSSHTLRKTFGKRVWEMDGKSERALVYLSEMFSHSSTAVTRRYIGISEENIKNIYVNL